jgi:hypothetical protein
VEHVNTAAERVQAALQAAERDLERLADARVTVAEVLADQPSAGEAGPGRAAGAGSVVPPRAEGIGVEALAPEYQQILSVLAAPEAAEGMRVKQIAVQLGGETAPARIEGVRATRVKRLARRGWATEVRPNVFGAVSQTAPAAAG